MIRGVGTDIVDIRRVAQVYQRQGGRFEARVLSASERSRAERMADSRRVEFLAGRFAAKEAIAKAVGCGLGALGMKRVSIETGMCGQPVIHWTGGLEAEACAIGRWHLSISHTAESAIAFAVWEDTPAQ